MMTDNNPQPIPHPNPNPQKPFKILLSNSSQLLISYSGSSGSPSQPGTDPSTHKLLYREYVDLPKQNQGKIVRWMGLVHPRLLQVRRVQVVGGTGGDKQREQAINNDQNDNSNIPSIPPTAHQPRTIGIYLQYYTTTLQSAYSKSYPYKQQQILNTFEPIAEAIDYLRKQNYNISAVGLNNIVVTEGEEIKFVDSCVLEPEGRWGGGGGEGEGVGKCDYFRVYEELCLVMYGLFVSSAKERSCKSWKNRLQILKKKLSKQAYSFFISIFDKSLETPSESIYKIGKTKKIIKQKQRKQKQRPKQKTNKRQKQKILQGKQNQILQ